MGSGKSGVTTNTRGLDILIDTSGEKLGRWIAGIAFAIEADVVQIFDTSPPGGNVYWYGSVAHVASLPGSPPNVDTGALRASIDVTQVGQYTYWIHDGVEYGVHLEYGGKWVDPRPFMTPVATEWTEIKLQLAVDDLDFLAGL